MRDENELGPYIGKPTGISIVVDQLVDIGVFELHGIVLAFSAVCACELLIQALYSITHLAFIGRVALCVTEVALLL